MQRDIDTGPPSFVERSDSEEPVVTFRQASILRLEAKDYGARAVR